MSRDEVHDLILGLALVALGYAFYQHQKAAQAATISQSDQTAIDTALSTAPTATTTVPAPPAVQGNSQTGYTFDMNTLLDGAY